MKNIWILTFILFCGINQLNAQIKLRTPEGKVVLLFDNGTWKYEEVKKEIVPVVKNKEVIEISKPISTINTENLLLIV